MADVYTTGSWKPFDGQDDEFRERWKEFVGWAASLPGAGRAVLARDVHDPGRYVSFMAWSDFDAVRSWKGSPEFKPRMSRVQEHIDKFAATELEVVAVVDPEAG